MYDWVTNRDQTNININIKAKLGQHKTPLSQLLSWHSAVNRLQSTELASRVLQIRPRFEVLRVSLQWVTSVAYHSENMFLKRLVWISLRPEELICRVELPLVFGVRAKAGLCWDGMKWAILLGLLPRGQSNNRWYSSRSSREKCESTQISSLQIRFIKGPHTVRSQSEMTAFEIANATQNYFLILKTWSVKKRVALPKTDEWEISVTDPVSVIAR